MGKKLPIGIEDFEEICTAGFYYVDKTGFIKELLDDWGKVNLFTRPRRFGKSLNMSMLQHFLEIGCRKEVFDGLKIAEETVLCEEYMGKFPVISLSLKEVNGYDYETAKALLCYLIGSEAMRFQFLLEDNKLTEEEKERYRQLIKVGDTGESAFVMSEDILMGSLKTLSELLEKHYGRKVIILIDEYDVPLAKAFDRGYYDQMVMLIRNLFGMALKTNNSLKFAVLTGCLRIAKESIFTGLNNLKVMSVLSSNCAEYFGFTDEEVRGLLDYYGLSEFYTTVKEWYDGYHFGNVDLYCPWDVICYCDELRGNRKLKPKNYWMNTSSNDVLRHFLEMVRGMSKYEIEQLMEGNTVEKAVRQELTYAELYDSIENIWSVLFTTGYLTCDGEPEGTLVRLKIPNLEVRDIFKEQILEWFQNTARRDGAALEAFCDAFRQGNAPEVERQFNAYLKKTISIRDTFVKGKKENLYHGILLGLLSYKADWSVSSNRESGEGYSDIMVVIEEEETGIIIEVKYPGRADLEAGCREALEQIDDRHYEEILEELGVKTVLKYGIACYQKRCRVACVC